MELRTISLTIELALHIRSFYKILDKYDESQVVFVGTGGKLGFSTTMKVGNRRLDVNVSRLPNSKNKVKINIACGKRNYFDPMLAIQEIKKMLEVFN